MIYQDLWANGKLIERGYRECEKRYEIIRDFCKGHFERGFTVLDIGANMCYFGIRLVEDFNCKVVAFEFHNFMQRRAHVSCSSASKNIFFINHKVSLRELDILSWASKFDLVLALSILHHVTEPIEEWEHSLCSIGRYAVVEYAGSDSKREKANIDFSPEDKGSVIGYGDSHLDKNKQRPIVVLKRKGA